MSCCSSFISAIDFGHQKGLLSITIAQRFAHSNFALSAVVVPAVIEKIDSFIDSRANNANALFGIALAAQVISTESDQGNLFTAAAQGSIWHSLPSIPLGLRLCRPTQASGHQ